VQSTSPLQGVLLPPVAAFLAALFILLVSRRPWRRRGLPEVGLWAGPLAAGVGAILCQLWSPPEWMLPRGYLPKQNTDWLVYLTAASVLVGLIEAYTAGANRLHGRLQILLLLAVLITLVANKTRSDWTGLETISWLLGLATVGAIVWGAIDDLSAHAPGPTVPLLMVILAIGSSLVASLSGSVKVGQFVAGPAAALGAFFVLSCVRWDLAWLRGALPVVFAVLAGCGLMGYFYSEVPIVCAILLVAAPLVAWLVGLGPGRRLRPWKATLFYAAATLIPVAVAIALALRTTVSTENPDYEL
jgi:hypothetical protein